MTTPSTQPSRIQKGTDILRARLQEQGLWTVLVWIFNRGFSYLTGVPLLGRSRISNHVYVGPQFNRLGMRFLQREGISAVVNMRIEHDDADEGLLLDAYCYLPTVDDTAPSDEHIDEGVQFMRRMIAEGHKVYIHCAGGIGRAPTMAAAYFMYEGDTLDEALTRITRVRPYIRIMPPQMALLQRLEARQEPRMGQADAPEAVFQDHR